MNPIQLSVPVDLQLAVDPDGPAQVRIRAYSGAIVRVAGVGVTMIDIAGVELGESTVLLKDHDPSIDGVVGVARVEKTGGELVAVGTLSRASGAARKIISLAKDGVPLQASVGLAIEESEYFRSGERFSANGKSHTAPKTGLRLIRKGVLKEISIVSQGADNSTAVHVAARRDNTMSTETENTNIELALAQLTNQFIEEKPELRAEFEALEVKATAEGWDENRLQIELLRASRPKTGGCGLVRHGAPESSQAVLQAAGLMLGGNTGLAVKEFGERVVQQAEDLRLGSMVDWFAAALRAERREVPATIDGILRASFSTVSVPNAVGAIVNKSLLAAYNEAPATWRSFSAVKSAKDFKTNTDIRPSFIGDLEKLGPGGEIEHGTVDEDVYTWSCDTYAKMIAITRKDLINDDRSFFSTIPTSLAVAGLRAVSDLIWQTIMSTGALSTFFTTSHSNYLSGGSSPLAIGSLTTAVAAMRKQRDAQGRDLDMQPATLVVPPSLEMTAKALVNSTEIRNTTENTTFATGNALQSIVRVEVEPRLENSDRHANASATQWYLFASASRESVVVGFLNGKQVPTVEMDQTAFNTLGSQWRAYFDFGCALADYRAALKSAGA